MATKKKPQGREVIPGEAMLAKKTRISVRYLRQVWRHGTDCFALAERLAAHSGRSMNDFLYGDKGGKPRSSKNTDRPQRANARVS